MRITIDIPAPLHQRLKSRAAHEGSSVKRLIVRGVEQVLGQKCGKPPRQRVKLPLIAAKRPGSVQINNARIYDIISFP